MKLVRFYEKNRVKCSVLANKISYGELKGDKVYKFKKNYFSDTERIIEEVIDLQEVKLLSPVSPGKIIGVGLNYSDHADEMDLPVPASPLIFFKPDSSVIGPEEPINFPSYLGRVDYEGELAVVIGKTARNIAAEESNQYVFGYTCGNDVTARHFQKKERLWARAKGYDTFLPLGPWIETEVTPDELTIKTMLNGKTCQQSSTEKMIFGVKELLEFITSIMTLNPGDVILTGTPPGVGSLYSGDKVEINIENIGTLSNPVIVD